MMRFQKDRISDLPDIVLADILSLLSIKDAVATSLLSKRWRYAYTWVTNLEFDHDHVHDHARIMQTFPCFKLFVDKVLQNCQSEIISTFKLHFSKVPTKLWIVRPEPKFFIHLEPLHFHTWMSYPLTRGVSELDICAVVTNPGKLPLAIFDCPTLLVLKLDVNLELELPHSVCLPNLKEFHLSLPSFPNDDSVTRLLSSCPSLEHLVLKGYWDTRNPIYVSAPFLRRLCMIFPDWYGGTRSRVVLNVPNLEYLEYQDCFALHYSIEPMNTLKKARVDLSSNVDMCPADVIFSLMSPLSNVELLFLDQGGVETLDYCETNLLLPIFPKLNHLELGCSNLYDWNKLLMEFINCTPSLETLTFVEGIVDLVIENDEGYQYYSEQEYQSWTNCQTIPSCLKFHLKKITIMKYEFTKWELEVVKYFLRNTFALEELILVCERSVAMEKKISLANTLQQLPRSSMICSIKIE